MARRRRGIGWPLSIRFRLTLLYAGVLAGTLILFGVALNVVVAGNLLAAGDRIHLGATRRTAALLAVQSAPDGSLTVALPQALLRPFSRPPGAPGSADPPGPPVGPPPVGMLAQVVDLQTAQVLARSPNLLGETMPFTPAMLAAAQRGDPFLETIRVEGQRFRMIAVPVVTGERTVAVLQVARSLSPDDLLLGQLRSLLVVLAAITLPAAAALGWLVAGRALGPIRTIAGTAARIGRARDFSRRIEHSGPPDELRHLAGAINLMLVELEQAHRDLAAGARETEQALAVQRRFAADASHELRTPLTTIRANAELLLQIETDRGGERAQALADIAEEAERLGRLVDHLLTLARADAGLQLTLRPTALRPLVEEALRQTQLLADAHDLELAAPEEVSVAGEPDALKQLILILLDNARKYTPPGGRITVRLAAGSRGVELSVADTGPGIALADIPRIFDRFYRSAAARQADGAGLGLAIAKWIAEQHRARIDVTSTPGGATFTVHFPPLSPSAS